MTTDDHHADDQEALVPDVAPDEVVFLSGTGTSADPGQVS